MHRCVYLMVHITKLQLQITFPKLLYIPHSACIHPDPGCCHLWDNNIKLTMGKDQRPQIYVGFVADIDIKILGVAPPGAGHAQGHIHRRGGGLFISARVFFPVWCHPWMNDGTDRWKLHEKRPRRPLLYV
jgi:hypothetical protein